MKLSLASLSIALLGFAVGTAFADSPAAPAAPTPAPAASPAAPAAPDANSGGDTTNDNSGADSGDEDTGPPPDAPVPDPFLAEVLKTCRDGASGDKGAFQRLQDAGWGLSVDGDTETPFYQAFNGEKDFDGVGTVDITYSLEVYPSLTEGYCSLSIDTAQRKIGIADIKTMPGLKGDFRQTDDGIASTWQDTSADASTFIQADQHARDLYFILDVTTLMKKPAADIPYIKPAPSDDNGGDDSDSDSTNAND